MCGIMGYIGEQEASRILVDGLRRLAVLEDPSTGAQSFYDGHDADIVCVCLHPGGELVASGLVGGATQPRSNSQGPTAKKFTAPPGIHS